MLTDDYNWVWKELDWRWLESWLGPGKQWDFWEAESTVLLEHQIFLFFRYIHIQMEKQDQPKK